MAEVLQFNPDLTQERQELSKEFQEITIADLSKLATKSAFEELASLAPAVSETDSEPSMTQTTWDHANKRTDNSDTGAGIM